MISKFKEVMQLSGVKGCISIDRNNLPLKIFFKGKDYIIKATSKDGLMMMKDEVIDDREMETQDPRDLTFP